MAKKLKVHSKDKIVHDVIKKFDQRSAVGLDKYGTTLHSDSDSLYRWVNDVQEELMDAILYLQKVKTTMIDILEESYIQDMKIELDEQGYEPVFVDENEEDNAHPLSMYPGDINVTFDEVKPDGKKKSKRS